MAKKKIGIVLALDGEKQYTQGVMNAKKESASLKAELKNLSAQYDGNANSLEFLQKKQVILTRQQDSYSKKLKEAQNGLEKANSNFQKQSQRLTELQNELRAASSSMEKMKKAGKEGTKEYQDQEKQVKELAEAVNRQSLARKREEGAISDWNKRINESESDLRKANKAIDDNAKHLDESKNSTDKCAKSIDKFGNEVKDATEVTTGFGEKLGMAAATKVVDAAVAGAKMLGNASKEAAKYVVRVGSDFEASMSKVAAISGASGKQLAEIEAKAKELGSTTKFSATEAADAFTYMSLAGWSTADMLSGIDGIMNLAAASGMELANASDMVTDYLSAFNLSAGEASRMADMLAYAQSHSNTTAEMLGEAYGNCAAILNSSGQDIETVTALLEGMANQGLKGSEAGTALSSIMTQITQKMKNGKIAIGDTNVEVADSEGNFRDLTDILVDVDGALEGMGTQQRSAALAATFNKTALSGLNLILNEGVGKVASYETALRNSDGAASTMATTMQDNLQGKITTMNSALEGLGIAAYDYIDGPLSSVVEGVTGVISGITAAITPQRTELETFISDIKTSNEEIATLLENANNTVTTSEIDISNLEAYKTLLLDLNGIEGKNEFQKYQIANVVSKLSESIPELAAAFDTETSSINLTNQEIISLIDNQEKLIRQEAYAKVMRDTQEALAIAQLNQIKAQNAVEEAQKNWIEVAGEGISTSEEYIQAWGEIPDNVLAAERALNDAKAAAEEANKLEEEAQGIFDDTKKAIDGMTDAQEDNTEVTEEGAKATQSQTEALEDQAEAQDAAAEAAKKAADVQKQAAQSVKDAYQNAKNEIESSFQNKISLFDMFDTSDGGEDMTVEKMTANLDSQIEAFENYQKNLEAVKEHVGKEISPEFMQYLESMGMEGANTLDHILRTFADEEPEKVKALNDRWMQAMDQSEAIANAGAANRTAYELAMGELGSSDADFSDLSNAINAAVESATGAWEGLPEETASALNQTVETAKQCGVLIPDGLAEGISSGEVTPEEAISQLNSSIQGTFDGLAAVAREQGLMIPEELSEGIASGGQAASDALNTLIAMITEQSTTASEAGAKVGAETASGAQASIESGTAGVEQASTDMVSAGATAAEGATSGFTTAGQKAVNDYVLALQSGKVKATKAGSELAQAAKNGISSQSGFISVGYNISTGVATGIRNGASSAIRAASNMAESALAAAKSVLGIQSPSRKFRNEVGAQISAGMAFGIKDMASLAGKAASRMSNKVYTNATNWLSKYKKSHKVSLEEEKWYWEQVLKHTKSGTTAYNNALKKIQKITMKELTATGLSDSVASKISNNFGVSRTTGSGKKKKNKDTETYYSEIFTAAQKYLSNQQALNEWSLQQELAYWKGVKAQLKSGTQAWYDATKQINEIKVDIAEAEKQKLTTKANVQDSILDKYKTYYNVSAKAEAEYWNLARKQFKAGTDERIDADQKYFTALQELYDQRKKLDEDYADNAKEINDDLLDNIQDLQDAYKDAVKNRKEDILSQMNLFDAWDSEGYDADTLIYNLKTQVSGLALWEQQLEELGRKKISAGLLEELRAMGPDAAASIYSLNQMTAQQLQEYNNLWEQRNALAESQAVKENETLRAETNRQISQLRMDAQAELNALNADYRAAISELNMGISGDLRALVIQAGSIGEEAVSGMIASIGKAATSVDTYNSTTKVVSTVSNQLGSLKAEGTVIGRSTLQNILDQLTDTQKINTAAKSAAESIKSAMANELIYRQNALAESLSVGNSGVTMLNSITQTYGSLQAAVTVDNSSVLMAMQQITGNLQALVDLIQNTQMVMDTGVVAAELQPILSQENASATIRNNRGSL